MASGSPLGAVHKTGSQSGGIGRDSTKLSCELELAAMVLDDLSTDSSDTSSSSDSEDSILELGATDQQCESTKALG